MILPPPPPTPPPPHTQKKKSVQCPKPNSQDCRFHIPFTFCTDHRSFLFILGKYEVELSLTATLPQQRLSLSIQFIQSSSRSWHNNWVWIKKSDLTTNAVFNDHFFFILLGISAIVPLLQLYRSLNSTE